MKYHSLPLIRDNVVNKYNPIIVNMQPSINILSDLPELTFDDVSVAYMKLLGMFMHVCVDFTILNKE